MEAIPTNQLLEYNSDTLTFLRKQYELDTPERMDEAIEILQDWLKKQDHIVKKNYPGSYLERVIIASKGSVEKAKTKFDKLATYRTLLPQFFEPLNDLANIKLLNDFIIVVPPKMTADHYRVFMLKNIAKHVPGLMDFFRYLIMICEYQQSHDYCNGIVAVFDYTEANMYELIKAVNVVEMQQALTIVIEGYSMRLKGIHFITASKAIDTFIQLVKKTLSKKVADRIQVHKDMESVYKYVPKEIMPSDYGGQAKTLDELSSNLKSALSSATFMKHLREMQNACTNENFRRDEKFNDQYMGMPGTFRKLSVD